MNTPHLRNRFAEANEVSLRLFKQKNGSTDFVPPFFIAVL